MTRILLRLLLGGWMLVSAAGCVSSSKYKDLEDRHAALETEAAAISAREKVCVAKNGEQEGYIHELESRVGQSKSDRTRLEANLAETRKALEESAKRKA